MSDNLLCKAIYEHVLYLIRYRIVNFVHPVKITNIYHDLCILYEKLTIIVVIGSDSPRTIYTSTVDKGIDLETELVNYPRI